MLTLLLTLVFNTSADAMPASPDLVDIRQPDGSTFKGRIQGDEVQGWTESYATGHTVLRNSKTGYWEYAEPGDNATLRLSGLRVLHSGQNAPSTIRKGLRPPRNKDAERYMQHMLRDSNNDSGEVSQSEGPSVSSSTTESAAAIWNPTPVSGTKKLLIILVSFANRSLQTTPVGWYSKIFDESDKSVAKFYKDNSFGLMQITPVTHTQSGNPAGVVSVTLPTNHPNTGSNYTFSSDQAWGNSALSLASAFVNFNSLDTNSNGKIETSEAIIYFVVAGYEASGSSKTPSVWAHAWSTTGTGLTAGSKNVQRWGQNGELNNSALQHPMGVVTHELGHQMCALPDLYDTSNTNAALGNFSIMAGGSWGKDIGEASGTTPVSMDAWSREYLGWSTPITPDMASPVSPFSFDSQLATPSSPYKLMIPSTSSSEYFLLENRWPTGWDLGLKGMTYFSSWQGGLLILHVDNNAGTSINSYNNTNNRQGVVPVQASTSTCNMLASGSASSCRGNPKTLYYSGNNTTWTPASSPNSNFYSGSATDFFLTAVSVPGSTMTAEFSYGAPTVPDSPGMGVATRGNGQATVSFSPPQFDGGSVITSYTATSSPGARTASGSGSPLTVSGLTNGTAYTFTVTATNANGISLASQASNSVTPATTPGAPVIGAVSVGSGLATVSFTPPASDGGSSISIYTVSANTGQVSISSDSPITVAGLVNGTSYTFTVQASNSVGTGVASGPSAIARPGVVRDSSSNEIGYQTLQSALDADTHATEIRVRNSTPVGPARLNEEEDVILVGGYDDMFLAADGPPSLLGAVTVVLKSGVTTRMRNVIIKP